MQGEDFSFVESGVRAKNFFGDFSLRVLEQQNLPLGGFAGLCESEVSQGGFFLTKRAPHEPGKLNEVQFHVAQIQGKILQKD